MEERLRQIKEEEMQIRLQMKMQEHAANYDVQVEWPAKISSSDPNNHPLRTDDELIQHRLIESGLLSEVPIKAGESVAAFGRFIKDLERTGCYNHIGVELARGETESEVGGPQMTQAKVTLDEKRWFRMHAGAGFKMDGWMKPELAVNDGFMPMGEAETTIGLVNLTGGLDRTDFHYTLDTRSQESFSLTHEQPLYRILPGALRDWLLATEAGSKFTFRAKALLDTQDFERTRSYKEYQRLLSFTACNQHSYPNSVQSPELYYGMDWSITNRDIVPRRHASDSFTMDASPEVISQAGPTLKHSIKFEFRTNGEFVDHPFSPAGGLQTHLTAEVALPPGNVGFAKCDGGLGIHLPVASTLSIHTIFNMGYLHPLSFGGVCQRPTLSDRFYVGGPMHLRGFLPAGIGPRTKSGGRSTPGGDALGGDFYYTATCMASISPRTGFEGIDHAIHAWGLRLFSFASAGTCIGVMSHTPLASVLRSSRATGGIGLASTALGPRMEISYAWPFRYGPADARQQAQFGIGFSFS